MAKPAASPIPQNKIRAHKPPKTHKHHQPRPVKPATKSQRKTITNDTDRTQPPNPRLKWGRVTLGHVDQTGTLDRVTFTASTGRIVGYSQHNRRGKAIS